MEEGVLVFDILDEVRQIPGKEQTCPESAGTLRLFFLLQAKASCPVNDKVS
jgi:hypothetical protein